MVTVKADYVEMINDADAFCKLAGRLYMEISRLKYVLKDVDIFWEGMANAEFHITLDADFLTMETLCLKIKYAGELLKMAVYEYVKIENALRDMIGGI